jgi:epoxyqueuosine reductase
MTSLPPESERVVDRLRRETERRGFTLFGVAPATDADGFGRFGDWLDRGFAGEMTYLHKYREHRRHPRAVVAQVRSVVMLGLEYSSGMGGVGSGVSESAEADTPDPTPHTRGRVAAYAHGPDYHRFIWDKLNELSAWLTAEVPGSFTHGTCDSAPLLERDFARRAGLGWFGKNTMLINKRRGSFFFLAALCTTVELPADPPHTASHCGTCTACLDACPTKAFPEPGVLDATKCISYLTIELRGAIPLELREPMGNWLFGCDVCQDVCPWNRHVTSPPSRGRVASGASREGGENLFPSNPDLATLDPVELLGLSNDAFDRRFAGTSLLRARRTGLLRNAAIVLGNVGDERALPALEKAMTDSDEVIAETAAWAAGRIRSRRQ